jgi:hypothetical protein
LVLEKAPSKDGAFFSSLFRLPVLSFPNFKRSSSLAVGNLAGIAYFDVDHSAAYRALNTISPGLAWQGCRLLSTAREKDGIDNETIPAVPDGLHADRSNC